MEPNLCKLRMPEITMLWARKRVPEITKTQYSKI
jgi:hypothetical protein